MIIDPVTGYSLPPGLFAQMPVNLGQPVPEHYKLFFFCGSHTYFHEIYASKIVFIVDKLKGLQVNKAGVYLVNLSTYQPVNLFVTLSTFYPVNP